jgi:hypothetical protein
MPVVATPAGNPAICEQSHVSGGVSPLSASCMNQHIIVPKTPTEPSTGRPVLTRTHAIEIPGGRQGSINFVMRDVNGTPVDLRACLCQPIESDPGSVNSLSSSVNSSVSGSYLPNSDSLLSSESSQSSEATCPCPYKVVFRLNEYLSGGAGCEFPVTLVDAANGQVTVNFSETDTQRAGVYFGEFAMVECTTDPLHNGSVVFSNRLYVVIGRDLWNNRMGCSGPLGPPSIAEVRLHLRDTDPSESFLLDNLAFSDEEIALAMYLPVQYWNEIPPPIGIHNTTTFPYRYHWLMAIAGYLFLTAAEQQRRNNLQYAASGVQVNDQDKEPNYEKAALQRLTEFREFVRRKKAEINLENAWGEVGSTYGRMGYF